MAKSEVLSVGPPAPVPCRWGVLLCAKDRVLVKPPTCDPVTCPSGSYKRWGQPPGAPWPAESGESFSELNPQKHISHSNVCAVISSVPSSCVFYWFWCLSKCSYSFQKLSPPKLSWNCLSFNLNFSSVLESGIYDHPVKSYLLSLDSQKKP